VKLVEEDVILSVVEEKEHGSESSFHETLAIALVSVTTELVLIRSRARAKPTPYGNRNILVSS